MTLIAGIKCADGYVICADTQVTVKLENEKAAARVTRQKLTPITVGAAQLAVAGAGDGDLIEAFVARFQRKFKDTSIVQLESIAQLFSEEIVAFAKEKRIPVKRIPDYLRFVVAAHSPGIGSMVWTATTGDMIDLKDWDLVGYDDHRYRYAIQNLYRPNMPISQGVFLGLYVMWLAEQTSNYVRAPITVAVLKRNGFQFEDQQKINRIDQKVRLFTSQFEGQFLACSDTGLNNTKFVEQFKEFGNTILQFRMDFVKEWVERAFEVGLDRIAESWNEMPNGTTVVTVPMVPKIEQSIIDQQRRASESPRQTHAHVQEQDRIDANLQTMHSYLQRDLASVVGNEVSITPEERQSFHEALTEINQAVMIGPMPLRPDFCNLLGRVAGVMPLQMDLGEHLDVEMHKACSLLRIAVIDQTIAYIERAKRSVPQTLSGQP